MSWNIGVKRNLFLKLKTKLGLYHVEVRIKPKDSPGKITLTLVETQQLPGNEKADSKGEFFSFKWTLFVILMIAFGCFWRIHCKKLLMNQLFGLDFCVVQHDIFYPHQDYEQVSFYEILSLYFIGWSIRN